MHLSDSGKGYIHLKILRLRMSLLHIMVVMDGWVGTCVTLSNGLGIFRLCLNRVTTFG